MTLVKGEKVMKTMSVALLTLLLLCVPIGCGPKPSAGDKTVTVEQMKDYAFTAGRTAALTYLAIKKPSIEQATKIKFVIDIINKTVTDWPEGGFNSALPTINALIDKEVSVDKDKALNLLCKTLAETLTSELDNLFNKHPEWKKKGSEVAGIVGQFGAGASKGFDDYIKS